MYKIFLKQNLIKLTKTQQNYQNENSIYKIKRMSFIFIDIVYNIYMCIRASQ